MYFPLSSWPFTSYWLFYIYLCDFLGKDCGKKPSETTPSGCSRCKFYLNINVLLWELSTKTTTVFSFLKRQKRVLQMFTNMCSQNNCSIQIQMQGRFNLQICAWSNSTDQNLAEADTNMKDVFINLFYNKQCNIVILY